MTLLPKSPHDVPVTTPTIVHHRPQKNIHIVLLYATCFVLLGFVISLGCLNFLTLVNADMHNRAYREVEGAMNTPVMKILGRTVWAGPNLDDSPTRRKEAELAALRNEFSARNARLIFATQTLVARTGVLVKQSREQQAAFIEVSRAHAILQKTHLMHKDAAGRLVQSLGRRITAGVRRGVVTVAAKIIPILGGAITVAATSYDLYDACEILKEISSFSTKSDLPASDTKEVCGLRIGTLADIKGELRRNWRAAYQSARSFLDAKPEVIPLMPVAPSTIEVQKQAESIFKASD